MGAAYRLYRRYGKGGRVFDWAVRVCADGSGTLRWGRCSNVTGVKHLPPGSAATLAKMERIKAASGYSYEGERYFLRGHWVPVEHAKSDPEFDWAAVETSIPSVPF